VSRGNRSIQVVLLASFFVLGSAEIAEAQGRGGGGNAGPPIPAYRVGVMQGFQQHTAAIRAILAGNAGAPSHLVGHANAIRDLTVMAADIFPAGSGGAGTRARDEIWSNATEFAARLEALRAGGEGLAQAAASGNNDQINAALMTLNGACQACHMAFRGPAPAAN
jgi:cytochrome c556